MIKEIYIDNFKCLFNFRMQPDGVQLWLGDNGSGKTSVLDVLRKIHRILNGAHVDDVFDGRSLTGWDQRLEQTAAVKLEIDGELYEYELVIEYTEKKDTYRIKKETLIWREKKFFEFDSHDAHLYRINRDSKIVEEGASFPSDWRCSLLFSIAKRDDNYPLIRFREEVERWLIVQSVPPMIKKEAWFSRPHGAHSVIKPYPTVDGLTPSETMARGWDDE